MQNSIKQNDTGPTGPSFLTRVSRYLLNSSDQASVLDPDKKRSIGSLLLGAIECTSLIVLIVLCLSLSANARASDVQPYLRIGAGWAEYRDGGDYIDNLAASVDIGTRFTLTDHWRVDARLGHGSFWFEGEGEPWVHYANIGIEYVW